MLWKRIIALFCCIFLCKEVWAFDGFCQPAVYNIRLVNNTDAVEYDYSKQPPDYSNRYSFFIEPRVLEVRTTEFHGGFCPSYFDIEIWVNGILFVSVATPDDQKSEKGIEALNRGLRWTKARVESFTKYVPIIREKAMKYASGMRIRMSTDRVGAIKKGDYVLEKIKTAIESNFQELQQHIEDSET